MNPVLYILSTGTELTTGRSRDGNGPYLARALAEEGFQIFGLGTLPDDPEILFLQLQSLMKNPSIDGVLMTGGMGPTDDDHTVDVIARLTGRNTVEEPGALLRLQERVRQIPNRIRLEMARRQVRIVEGATVLKNEQGMAPGMLVELERPEASPFFIAAMSGFPQEMHPIFEKGLLPELRKRFQRSAKYRRVFRIYGEPESSFESAVFGSRHPTPDHSPDVPFASLSPSFQWGVSAAGGNIRIFVESENQRELEELVAKVQQRYQERYLEGSAEDAIHEFCSTRGITIGAAESCTGGLVGKILTDRPGSSVYFNGSIVTYANSAKQSLLGVPEKILQTRGAVSEECAKAMAEGALRALGSSFALAITGIAGPDGGTPEKPVGTVYVACAGGKNTEAHRLYFPLDRERVREFTAGMALFLLYRYIEANG